MQGIGLYCTTQLCRELILSFQLLGDTSWADDKIIACLYSISNHVEQHYHPAEIEKSDGSFRHILVPDPLLKKIQRNILHHILDPMPVSAYATAYQRGGTIVSNAVVHVGKKQVLKLDMKDFFGSILFYMVYQRVFSAQLFPPAVSTLLTYLCCYKDYLPQGAPTSAAISNLVMKPFDEYMGLWCAKRDITYTRYCDDMTFSGEFHTQLVRNKVGGYLYAMGFELNRSKTKILPDSGRQIVTGIVVNDKPQVSKEYRKKLRQELYYCEKFGVKSHLCRTHDTYVLSMGQPGIIRYLSVMLGKVTYLLQVNPQDLYFQNAVYTIKKLMKENQTV